MEKKNFSFMNKFLTLICIIVICFVGYFMVILPYLNQGEGDPYFKFYEVPFNATQNGTVVHLEDDIMNVRGLDVKIKDGKISRIYIRNSEDPEINTDDFFYKYGTSAEDTSSIKYIEYKGVYYYALGIIP